MIYFLKHVESGLIKIGKTHTYSTRFYALERQFGALELLGVMDGYSNQETDLHIQFSHLNERDVLEGREWFRDNGEIIRYVTRHTHLDLSKYVDGIYADIGETTRFKPPRVLEPVSPTVKPSKLLMSKIPQLVLDKKSKDGINYKNKEIAEELGITDSMVSLVMRDKIDVSGMKLSTAIAWADWLDCNVQDLFEIVES